MLIESLELVLLMCIFRNIPFLLLMIDIGDVVVDVDDAISSSDHYHY